MARHRRQLSDRIDRQGLLQLGSGVTARQQTGALADPPDAIGAILDAMPERELQVAHVVEGLRNRGWIVWTVPRMQMTTAGLPDLLAYHPSLPGLLLCWELKRQKRSRPTAPQRQALAHLMTVPGVDARIVRPRTWPVLRDALDSADPRASLAAIPRE